MSLHRQNSAQLRLSAHHACAGAIVSPFISKSLLRVSPTFKLFQVVEVPEMVLEISVKGIRPVSTESGTGHPDLLWVS
jgi:hypothetical protein